MSLPNSLNVSRFYPLLAGRQPPNGKGDRKRGQIYFLVHSFTGAQYDARGNLTQRTDATWGYDALRRLTQANGAFGDRTYAYDQNGNRVQLTSDGQGTSYSYEPASNRLAGSTDWTVTRDANGNTLSRLAADGSGALYAYTAHNRLATVTDRAPPDPDTLAATYTYNGLGQRVRKDVGGTVTAYVYGLEWHI